MWLSTGTQQAIIAHRWKGPTSEARYGAMLLYFVRNKQRGDMEAIEEVVDRLPRDISLVDDYNLIRNDYYKNKRKRS